MFFKRHVFCCTNKRPDGHPTGCCASKDAERLRNYLKARVKELGIPDTRVNASGCLDRCHLGPVLVMYPEGIWYRPKSIDDIEKILQNHILNNAIVRDLQVHDHE